METPEFTINAQMTIQNKVSPKPVVVSDEECQNVLLLPFKKINNWYLCDSFQTNAVIGDISSVSHAGTQLFTKKASKVRHMSCFCEVLFCYYWLLAC